MASVVDSAPSLEAPSSKRLPPTNLTVNTSLPPAPTKSNKPPSAKRSSSSSSLVTSPSSSSTATTRKTVSPSVSSTNSKRSSPRCSSPACAASLAGASDRSAWLYSPSSSSASRASPTVSSHAPPPLSPPITTELYFRLLKKSHVLDQLLHVHSHLATQQQQLRRLEADRARADSVQAFVFQELDEYKRKFVEAQQFMLELLEALTALTLQEHELQRGTGTNDAQQIALRTKEDVVVRDLELKVSEMQLQTQRQHQTNTEDSASDRSLESRALRAVGLHRIEQLAGVCAAYETQLRKSEAELSRAMHSAYKDECLAKLQRYEAAQQQHDDEIRALSTRIDNLTSQTCELQGVIDDQRDELAQLKEASAAQQQRHAIQTLAIEKFGTELKAELRKRYGVVPSVVDSRWHAFFPTCAAPE